MYSEWSFVTERQQFLRKVAVASLIISVFSLLFLFAGIVASFIPSVAEIMIKDDVRLSLLLIGIGLLLTVVAYSIKLTLDGTKKMLEKFEIVHDELVRLSERKIDEIADASKIIKKIAKMNSPEEAVNSSEFRELTDLVTLNMRIYAIKNYEDYGLRSTERLLKRDLQVLQDNCEVIGRGFNLLVDIEGLSTDPTKPVKLILDPDVFQAIKKRTTV